MRECEREDMLCTCVDWGKDDLAARIHHIICNFEFTGFGLEYTTLERPEGRRLCRIGRCRVCGKRLCYGDDLPAQSTPDDLLADIFHRTFQMPPSIFRLARSVSPICLCRCSMRPTGSV